MREGDVVILPAFGASVHEMKFLADRGANIVDTTCPWVSKSCGPPSINTSERSSTSIIHGKYSHEETVATASFATRYLIVKDMKEATYVREYILNGGDKAEFMEKFKNAMSADKRSRRRPRRRPASPIKPPCSRARPRPSVSSLKRR